MSFRRDLYERVMHKKDFGKTKNKIYDILGWFCDYSISTIIAMEFPIGGGMFMDYKTCKYCNLKELTDNEILEFMQTMKSERIAVLQENESVILHGKWIDRGYEVECPFCGFTCNDTHYLGNGVACPNCAARMDG